MVAQRTPSPTNLAALLRHVPELRQPDYFGNPQRTELGVPPRARPVAARFRSLVGLVEGGVEGDGAAGEIQAAHEGRGFGTAVDAVHADVLPLDG